MTQVLHEAHVRCSEAFSILVSVSPSPLGKDDCQALEAEFDRYKLWADNVGAAHCGRTYRYSLDYRLREASFYKDQVSNFLSVLTSHIERATEIIDGTRVPFEVEQELEDDDYETEEDDDSAWDPCSDSEIDELLEKESPQTKSPSETFDRLATTDPSQSPIQSTSEIGQILKSITRAVSALYRLPIRRPAPMDRIRDGATQQTACYQHFDILHAKSKFPCMNEHVATRLGRMNTRRRQLLLYRRTHDETQRTGATRLRLDRPAVLQSRSLPEDGASDAMPGEGVRRSMLSPSQQGTNEITLRSKATTLYEENPPPPYDGSSYEPSEAESRTSMVPTEETAKIHIEMPPRPKDSAGRELTHFRCSFCSIAVSHIHSERSWKRHVLKDLLPYVCTFPDCDLSDHLFDNREDWFTHEAQYHRVNYFCNESGHEEYGDTLDFLVHMKDAHRITLNDTPQPTKLLRAFRKPTNSLAGTCNLCLQPTKSIKYHVSLHLEQLCLFAIPRANYHSDNETARSASDAAIQSEPTHSGLPGSSLETDTDSQFYPDARDENIPDVDETQEFNHLERFFNASNDLGPTYSETVDSDWGCVADDFPEALEECGVVRGQQRNWDQDENILRRQLKVKEDVLGADNLEVFRVVTNLACVCAETKKISEAEGLMKKSLDGLETMLGKEHKITLRVSRNLGLIYRNELKLGLAETTLRGALRGCRKTFGAEHKETYGTMLSLSRVVTEQGEELDEVEKMMKQSLEGLKRTLGQDVETLRSACWLANLYEDGDRFDEAAAVYQRELEDCERMLGKEDPWTLAMVNLLGSSYLKVSRYDQAESIWKQAMEEHNGPDQNFACRRTICIKLANLYHSEKRHNDAEKVWKWQLEQSQPHDLLDESTFNTLDSLREYYEQQGRPEKALQTYRAVLDRIETLDSAHEAKSKLLYQLGQFYLNEENLDEAERMYKRALGQSKSLEPRSDTYYILRSLALLHEHQGRLREADSMHQLAIEFCKSGLGLPPWCLVQALVNRGQLKMMKREFNEAEKVLQCSVTESSALGPGNACLVWAFDELANMYEKWGKPDEARRTYELLLDRCEFSIPGHRETAETAVQLAGVREYVIQLHWKILRNREKERGGLRFWTEIVVECLAKLLYWKICNRRFHSDQGHRSVIEGSSPSISHNKTLVELVNLYLKDPDKLTYVLDYIGRALLWIGLQEDASIIFQHLSVNGNEPVCDICLKPIRKETGRYICKVCADIDLCERCFQQGQDCHWETRPKVKCWEHETFAVPKADKSTAGIKNPIFNKESFIDWLLEKTRPASDEKVMTETVDVNSQR